MIPYAIIGILFVLYVLSDVMPSVFDRKWDELKETLPSVLFFPCVALVFLSISLIFGLTSPQSFPEKMTLNYLFYDAHILILLPSTLISLLILIPLHHHIENYFTDK
ncbi:hypothetical protein [Vibrio salinus]|uniref:hypothetical protein n=1 Tax=Vibrio salinus TaxID=2899784 RepID=UPI001E425F4B|nr:hypothetical protein [Vibrio salinus]MCE0495074.1 hypothetical protein [Vibrio salinus]